MAGSLMNMLDDLESRLERTQAELKALREENQRLKQRLSVKDDVHEQSAPNMEMAAEERAPDKLVPDEPVPDEPVSDKQVPAQKASDTVADGSDAAADGVTSLEIADTVPSDQPAQAPSPHALLNQWYERYPKAFFKGHTKPLKVGIHQDLAEREQWPNKLIRRALANYVNLPRYVKAVRIGAERVDLDGQPAGKVDKEAALHASEKRGDKKEPQQPKKNQPKPSSPAKKPYEEPIKPPAVEKEVKKSEPRKPLSMEDKLLGLQQKFKGR